MKHIDIDVWGTAEKLQKEGYSAYDMILAASQIAKEISKHRNFLDAKEGRLIKHPYKPINQALKDIETEVNNKESE